QDLEQVQTRRPRRRFLAEILERRTQEVVEAVRRVRHVCRRDLRSELAQDAVENGRLSRTDLTDQGDEAAPVLQAVLDRRHGLAVLLAEEEKRGIGGQAERLPREPEMLVIHGTIRSARAA